ncbi:Zinc finger-containing ubiquitin peptidase 1 [Pseudocercospora fuligena]|uniref:Zinc finger-containing ubiquitin peptidase 1 n=1 Tax=Pseudocercospora fuligena TaxID=685502 RepID=A0A8H6RFW6_9PEZI|nr:Zinc finger-containing ubiquitin peptidase 1 [Pseudocercospora fuligena]
MANSVVCPFCGSFKGADYDVQLHIEEYHTDDSPFVAHDEEDSRPSSSNNASRGSRISDSMPGDTWTKCTRPGCGEHVLLSEVDEHLNLHEVAALSEQEAEGPRPPLPPRRSPGRSRSPRRGTMGNRLSAEHANISSRSPRKVASRPMSGPMSGRASPEPRSHSRAASILSYFSGTSTLTSQAKSTIHKLKEPNNPIRLGKRELGPYAFEKSMPSEVRKDLLRGAGPREEQKIGSDGRLYRRTIIENETSGLIPLIADLCTLDPNTTAAYLCHPSTKHIRKIRCDGNFCGYWNIQVAMTYIQHMNPDGPQEVPDVIRIQDTIEKAWDNGKCPYGRLETGGIRNTRKWIGTNEALAFFQQINIRVEALSFKDSDEDEGSSAVEGLLDYVEAYFMSGIDTAESNRNAHITTLAPIYFQRFGHSMSIVGIERRKDGSRNLLMFDSSFGTSLPVQRLLADRNARVSVENALKAYRRSDLSLTRWDEFEILVPHPGPVSRSRQLG